MPSRVDPELFNILLKLYIKENVSFQGGLPASEECDVTEYTDPPYLHLHTGLI